MIGIVTLDEATYRAIKTDPGATRQALVIIGLATLAGIASRFDSPVPWQIASLALGLVGWVISAWLTVLIGTHLLGAPDGDVQELFRLRAYTAPTGIGGVLRAIPVIGPLLYYSLTFWGVVLLVKATKVGLEIRTGRAITASLLATRLELRSSFWSTSCFGNGAGRRFGAK